ncbi:DUF4331 family protein [Gloeocapsa sp. PCC 73106]|uniref:DUF4331 family protein n=1 Tax=Gloeocapsa sp. PCC 73106 TaxID=102232 RepID=UPI0002ABEB4A|nr:DUF4331 family protein [Gloeocapsa sp. PCC 73106]ELR96419.1 hypothetical protein GLO73106DRAFT_00002130 [Gloeocapsa sp. PCC 73106]
MPWLIWISPVYASDHQDSPKMLQTPEVDLVDLYAFTKSEDLNVLVLIMGTWPVASDTAWFSPAFNYSMVLRPAQISGKGDAAGFTISDQEFRFDCHFKTPVAQLGSQTLSQKGTCSGPGGLSVPVKVNNEKGSEVPGMRVFAGKRLDSFFLDFANVAQGNIGPNAVGKNSLQNKNILSIVIETNIDKVFGSNIGSLFAIVSEANTFENPILRVDRQGRSEMTNVTLSFKQFDQVNKDLDVRDLYNQENTFKLSKDYLGTFRARYNANLGFWDNVDNKLDWTVREDGQHPLTEMLLNDVLVIDTSKPCQEGGYLEIEKAILADRPYELCGGRFPNEDTIDETITFYINKGNGPRMRDGVDQPSQRATDTFPYLAPPYVPPVQK